MTSWHLSALCMRRSQHPLNSILESNEHSPIEAAARGMLMGVANAWNILSKFACKFTECVDIESGMQ